VKPALTAACPQKSALPWPHAGASASRPVPSACHHPPQSRRDADTKGARLKQRTPASKFSTSYLLFGRWLPAPAAVWFRFDWQAPLGGRGRGPCCNPGPACTIPLCPISVCFWSDRWLFTSSTLHSSDTRLHREEDNATHLSRPAACFALHGDLCRIWPGYTAVTTAHAWRIGVGGDDEMQLDSQADPTHPGSGGSRCLIEHSCLHVDGCISYPSNHQHRLSHRLPARKNSSLTFLFFLKKR